MYTAHCTLHTKLYMVIYLLYIQKCTLHCPRYIVSFTECSLYGGFLGHCTARLGGTVLASAVLAALLHSTLVRSTLTSTLYNAQ